MENYENIALALGGNIGDTEVIFNKAIKLLEENGLKNIKTSFLYSNPAVDCIPGTPDFINTALTGQWNKSPRELLKLCQDIEKHLGRPESHTSDTSRIVDIDIILFGNLLINEQGLKIPHPKACDRLFVLLPLEEIASDWIFPDKKKKVCDLLNQLQS